jgi:hypothetical protein
MNFLELANKEARQRAEADSHAIILVGPHDRLALSDMMNEDGRLEIVHRYNPGINERNCVYVKCEDEWAVEGLEKAWTSYVWFRRRLLPPQRNRRNGPSRQIALRRTVTGSA